MGYTDASDGQRGSGNLTGGLRLGVRDGGEVGARDREDHPQGHERGNRRAFSLALAAEYSLDTHLEDAAVRAEHKLRERSAVLFQERQRSRIGQHIAANRDRELIAAALALAADLLGHPPDGGVIEQNRFDDRLDHADEVIVAADVGEFVA